MLPSKSSHIKERCVSFISQTEEVYNSWELILDKANEITFKVDSDSLKTSHQHDIIEQDMDVSMNCCRAQVIRDSICAD